MADKQNKMPEVAALLGVEIGEELKVEGEYYNPHKLTGDGLIDCEGGYSCGVLMDILCGKRSIEKLPWKPKDGNGYYYVGVGGDIRSTCFDYVEASDFAMVECGNCFRTKEEAEANRETITKKFGWN